MKDIAKALLTKSNARWAARLYNKYLVTRAEHFEAYKIRMLTKFETVSNSVLGNEQKQLKDVFVAQYLLEENGSKEVKVEGYPEQAVREYKRIVIKDYAGRGKSTLMKQMFMDACDKGLFPIFIELRCLNEGETLLGAIRKSLNEIDKEFDEGLLKYLIKKEDFVFFLDGFDEVKIERRGEVAKMIRSLVDRSQSSSFILTSRNDDALSGFGDFKGFTVKDFTLDQACDLILKYDNSDRGNELVKALQDGKHKEVSEFLKSPLHTVLFYKVFRDKYDIPFKLHEVCYEIFQSLFVMHDLSKDGDYEHQKKCHLADTDYMRVFGYLAFYCLKTNSYSIPRTDIAKLMAAVRDYYSDLKFKDEDMLYDMTVALSLFKDHVTEISWIHECMCNYFAVCYVRMDKERNRAGMFENFYNSSNLACYRDMLIQYSEIEPIEFRKFMTTLLLKEMQKYYLQSMANAKSGLTCESIEARCYLLFKNEVYYEHHREEWDFSCQEKGKTFLVDLLYNQFKSSFALIQKIDVIPSRMTNERLSKRRMRINCLSEFQEGYDYANSKAADISVDDYHYLPLRTIADLLTQLNATELLTEETDMLKNI